MSKRLASISGQQKDDVINTKSAILQPFFNKCHIMRIMDIPYLNLGGLDIIPNRDHVFHVTFPAEWKTTDLITLFAAFGSVSVSWTSDTTAYVSLREFVQNAKSVIMSTLNCSSVYKIMPYEAHKKMEAICFNVDEAGSHPTGTGITPMMEKASFPEPPEPSKKRSASPEREMYKRSKSITQEAKETKLFDDHNWD